MAAEIWNRQNYYAISVPVDDVNSFKTEFLQGVSRWFYNQLSTNEDKNEIKREYGEDITDPTHWAVMFDNEKRKNKFGGDMSKRIRIALNGGSKTSQGIHGYKGLQPSGFGITSHLFGLRKIYRDFLPAALVKYQHMTGSEYVVQGVSSIIVKPPTKKELFIHTDVFSLNSLYNKCIKTSSVSEWICDYGTQNLYHIYGARDGQGGQTSILSPLPIYRYLVILCLFRTPHVHPKLKKVYNHVNFEQQKGADEFHWSYIDKYANRICKKLEKSIKKNIAVDFSKKPHDKEWWDMIIAADMDKTILDKIRTGEMPSGTKYKPTKTVEMMPVPCDKPYIISWPMGFPHSAKATGDDFRFTLVLDIVKTTANITTTHLKRSLNRLHILASASKDSVKLEELEHDDEPYARGGPHYKPESEIYLYSFFDHMYVTEAEDFLHLFGTSDNIDVSNGQIRELSQMAYTERTGKPYKAKTQKTQVMERPFSSHVPLYTDGMVNYNEMFEAWNDICRIDAQVDLAMHNQNISELKKRAAAEATFPLSEILVENTDKKLNFSNVPGPQHRIMFMSVHQPAASAIVDGHKNMENRKRYIENIKIHTHEWCMIRATSTSMVKTDADNLNRFCDILEPGFSEKVKYTQHILGFARISTIVTSAEDALVAGVDAKLWSGPSGIVFDQIFKFKIPLEATQGPQGLGNRYPMTGKSSESDVGKLKIRIANYDMRRALLKIQDSSSYIQTYPK